jgi:hypothetical protein
MRDMRPIGDRSIRNIPVPPGHKLVRQPVPQDPEEPMYEEDFSRPQRPRRRRFFGSRLFWALVIVIVVCGAAGILMSTYFAGASITVSPRTAVVTAPGTVTASLNAPAGSLAYQVVNGSRTASTSVPATGTKQVSNSASGVITIYNAYSASSQDLVANTRFQTPDGKIYRIRAATIVPGATKASDGTLTPGTVSMTAYADKPGAEYNSGAVQLSVPGFASSPDKFAKFYAKSAGFAGGLVGAQPAVADTDLANAEQALKQSLGSAMQAMVQTQIPKEYALVPGTLETSYTDITETPGPNNTAVLAQTANANADVVAYADLASVIAKQTVQGYNGEAVQFADPAAITIATATSTTTGGALTLKLSGSPTLVWQFDPATLKQALLGKPKSDFETILKSFAPAINCSTDTPCKASIRPFWSSTFPSDASKVDVETSLPKS